MYLYVFVQITWSGLYSYSYLMKASGIIFMGIMILILFILLFELLGREKVLSSE